MRLSDLQPNPGSRRPRKRLGRGPGSGLGKTSGRGQKGQKARTGHKNVPAYFEGGQNRFSQRMPYLGGFKNPFRKEYTVVNLGDLSVFESGANVTSETLAEKGLIRQSAAKGMLKVLGQGTVDRPLKVTAHKVSTSAREQIIAAGGSVSLIEIPSHPKTKRAKKSQSQEA
ncbi:MAG: 50S ribosomal protein L15 [Ktedonobacterales bacterium]